MSAVALIGPDGAGKTTLSRMLERSASPRVRYLYMGINVGASNVALPTSRLAALLRRRLSGSRADRRPLPGGAGPGANGDPPPRTGTATPRLASTGRRHARAWAVARLLNRVAEAWYRQIVSWYLQSRGHVVLYDRHFALDFAPELTEGRLETFDRRLQRWLLTRLYPLPDLVIFLDAPGEVLYRRKGESSPEELERRRRAFLRQAERLPAVVRVDATRPLEDVYAEVRRHVFRFCGADARGRPAPRAVTGSSMTELPPHEDVCRG